jgi:hypothetical protein
MSEQEIRNGITRRETLYLGAGLVVASAGSPFLVSREVQGAPIRRFQQRLPTPPTLAPDSSRQHRRLLRNHAAGIGDRNSAWFADEDLGI